MMDGMDDCGDGYRYGSFVQRFDIRENENETEKEKKTETETEEGRRMK